MKKLKLMPIFLCLCLVTLINMHALYANDVIPVEIQVSPSTIQAFAVTSGDWLTVHTDIAYNSVAVASVQINGLDVNFTKSDDRGYLVAKIKLSILLKDLQQGQNVITLAGSTLSGEDFSGSDTILFIVEPGKRHSRPNSR